MHAVVLNVACVLTVSARVELCCFPDFIVCVFLPFEVNGGIEQCRKRLYLMESQLYILRRKGADMSEKMNYFGDHASLFVHFPSKRGGGDMGLPCTLK